MISAIVLSPGKAEDKSDRLYVVVKIPTIECSISHIPAKLPMLNVFQKGVAFFLLAGLETTDDISTAMGITDSDFTNLLLSELEGSEYAKKKGAQEFAPTKKLRQEFQKTVESNVSLPREMFAFLPVASGTTMIKLAGPFSSVQPTEVDQSVVDAIERICRDAILSSHVTAVCTKNIPGWMPHMPEAQRPSRENKM